MRLMELYCSSPLVIVTFIWCSQDSPIREFSFHFNSSTKWDTMYGSLFSLLSFSMLSRVCSLWEHTTKGYRSTLSMNAFPHFNRLFSKLSTMLKFSFSEPQISFCKITILSSLGLWFCSNCWRSQLSSSLRWNFDATNRVSSSVQLYSAFCLWFYST